MDEASLLLFKHMFQFYHSFAGNIIDNKNKLFQKEFEELLDEEDNIQQMNSFQEYQVERIQEFTDNKEKLEELHSKIIPSQQNKLTSAWYKLLCNLKQNYSVENDNLIQLARAKEMQHLLSSQIPRRIIEEKSREFEYKDIQDIESLYSKAYYENIEDDSSNYPVVQHMIEVEKPFKNEDDYKWVHYALDTELFNIQTQPYCDDEDEDAQKTGTVQYMLFLVDFLKGAYKSLDNLCSSQSHRFTAFEELLAVLETAVYQNSFDIIESADTGMYHLKTVFTKVPGDIVNLEIKLGICPPSIDNHHMLPYMVNCFIKKILYLQKVHKHLCININITTNGYTTRHTICIVQQFKKSNGICFTAEIPKVINFNTMKYQGKNIDIVKHQQDLQIQSQRIIPFHEDHMMLTHLAFLQSIPDDDILTHLKNDIETGRYMQTIFVSEFNFAYYLTIVNLQDETCPIKSENLWKIYFTYVPYYLSFFTSKKDTKHFFMQAKHSHAIIPPKKAYMGQNPKNFHFHGFIDPGAFNDILTMRSFDYSNPGDLGLGYMAMIKRKERRTGKKYNVDHNGQYMYYLNDVIPGKVLCKTLSLRDWNKVDILRARMQVAVSSTLHAVYSLPTFFTYRKMLSPTNGNHRVYPFREYYNNFRTKHPGMKDHYQDFMAFWLDKIQHPLDTWNECNETTQHKKGRLRH